MTVEQFKTEYRAAFSGDIWSSAMDAWFECAAHLYYRDIPVPGEWKYKPGTGVIDPRDPDTVMFNYFSDATDDDLIAVGKFLFRYCRYLKYLKKDF